MTERVRITHPRTEAARRVATRAPTREIDEQTAIGDLYMESLIRSQRTLAVIVCLLVAGLLMGTALIGAVLPAWGDVRVLGLALPWMVLGFAVYPVLIALAAVVVHQAERPSRSRWWASRP
jgi:hypothetical protein